MLAHLLASTLISFTPSVTPNAATMCDALLISPVEVPCPADPRPLPGEVCYGIAPPVSVPCVVGGSMASTVEIFPGEAVAICLYSQLGLWRSECADSYSFSCL